MEKFSYLADVQWLYEHLDSPDLVVIDTRFSLSQPQQGYEQYRAGHIPGAYYLDLNQDLSSSVQDHGGRHPLPDWDTFVDKLDQMGIHSDQPSGPTQIVIYDDSRFAFAARLWWMLRYLGHEQVAILNGGIQAWKSAGFALSKEVPVQKSGNFVPDPQTDWIVDVETVRQQKDKPDVVIIDARSPERWQGKVEPIDPVAGSIPSSVNSFWKDTSTEDGRLKSTGELAEHWNRLELPPETIVYCGSGVTACVNLFSLVMAGHPMYKLYPGGWSDWCSYL
ncbi:rhodanese-like domain protein [Synechococcus sp. PCC 7335]|uniref:sulfurtransferase n=1 Tax=Synechococcus sp. (strain ATCC 29403 / PCC 7335) TaxID=91464 RepID=UPI00017ECAB0|nr:sulfurtransferase [Synechococcus sp. PCC 7335]EDX83987.1 rhodanese-like domain protein [Synechococcus sp. PCC 7335]